MSSGPTRGAKEPVTAWQASPRLAVFVRVVAFATPVVAAYFAIRFVGAWLYRPEGWLGLGLWIVQAAAVGAVVSNVVGRGTRRLLPLATLLRLTLIFPDRAPSRFGVALRSGTVRQMRQRARELERDGLGSTAAEAAENAIVLVNGLGRHDRLTRGHTERVRAYADLIAEEMGLSETDRNWLAWGVLLHDVGKMTVPPEVLNKTEKLTDDEWQILKNHGIDPAPTRSAVTWIDFLRSQAAVACDFFTVDTATLRRYYVLFFIHIETREVFYAGVTANPTGGWNTQAARNLFIRHSDQLAGARALVRDR